VFLFYSSNVSHPLREVDRVVAFAIVKVIARKENPNRSELLCVFSFQNVL
jgi:hypothetical protein